MASAVQERYFGFGDIHSDFLRDSSTNQRQDDFMDTGNPNSEIECGNTKYKVLLNIKPYNVEEISVRVAANNCIKVEGTPNKTDELNNSTSSESSHTSSSSPSSSLKQSFHLPSDAEMKKVTCNLSDDGIVTIVAPRRYSIPEGAGLVDFPILQL